MEDHLELEARHVWNVDADPEGGSWVGRTRAREQGISRRRKDDLEHAHTSEGERKTEKEHTESQRKKS
jgi:hypothetical protein